MSGGTVFLIMLVLIVLGIPVAFSITASSILFLIVTELKPLLIVPQKMITGLDSFPLLAVPLFILVGNLMDVGGISKRLVKWCDMIVGGLPGGLGIVTIMSCTIFAALTGSGPATVAAIGAIMIPSMIQNGYKLETAGGMVAAAGALGPIIPPSICMIVYGVTMNLSVPAMFMGGVIPGLIIAFLLIIVNTVIALRSPEILIYRHASKFSAKAFLKITVEALGALLLPVVVLGGIYGGIFTPTEAASIGVIYSLIVGMLVYRELKLKDLPKILLKSIETAAMVNFIIGCANILSWITAVTQLSKQIIDFLMTFVNSQFTYLIMLNLFLFVVGALLDTSAAIILIAPVLIPLGISLGLDPLHLGVLFTINIVVGYVTPPFGYNLFTACSITGLKFDKLVRGVLPFMLIEMAAVMLFAYVPGIITWLPRAFGY